MRSVLTTHSEAEAICKAIEVELADVKVAVEFSFDRGWASDFPVDPGVYVLFEGPEPVYVGETGSIRGRMRDLRNTMNHTVRRAIGAAMYSGRGDFVAASSKRRFSDEIEKLLNIWLAENVRVRAIPVVFGRKEVEEYLIDSWNPRFNSKSRRRVR